MRTRAGLSVLILARAVYGQASSPPPKMPEFEVADAVKSKSANSRARERKIASGWTD